MFTIRKAYKERNRVRPTHRKPLAVELGYSTTDRILILNTDDVGMHPQEVEAVMAAFDFGLVKTGSIMVPCPGYETAVRAARTRPRIDLGIHLTLTCEWGSSMPWEPLLSRDRIPSLYSGHDHMWESTSQLLSNASRSELIAEIKAQIDRALADGIHLTHLDHHMDFYYDSELFADVMKVSREFCLPMRVWRRRRYLTPFLKNAMPWLRRKGFVFPDSQMGIYGDTSLASENERRLYYLRYMESLPPGVHNIKLHVGRATADTVSLMGEITARNRDVDFRVWTDPTTKGKASDLGIEFIGYKPLQRLQRRLQMGGERDQEKPSV